MSETPTRLDKTAARAGRTVPGMRYVLFGGLALIILAGIILYAFVH